MSQEPDVVTRRAFLRTSALGAALSWTVPVFIERTFSALNAEAAESSSQVATGKDHPILVVLQLAGGNDGLNAVIPYADDAYYRSRPTIGIAKDKVLKLNGHVGFNPALAPFKALYDEGNLALLQGLVTQIRIDPISGLRKSGRLPRIQTKSSGPDGSDGISIIAVPVREPRLGSL